MYLKRLEVVGFKSFAGRTKLEFERGLTAIVGPNGCGKSNTADAIRWVLGEQSAKAMRGSKMQDCIFNGTDTQKAVSMAEVSLTLADCETTLNTEFNEVTVTRRVFRSGEGQYLINKIPCRLKDVQRLFMDTGIGTNSYSLMEQGRIDLILSSRPEDRRAVFEEASGITKFKADKKEALRKLDHTEANLLRLEDIIKEVKRQIISLQRQAGKARRYKELQLQLRGIDIFATKQRLSQLRKEVTDLESKLAALAEREEALREDVKTFDEQSDEARSSLASSEEQIGQSLESSVQARNNLERTRAQIQVNKDRINELIALSDRDTKDMDEAGKRLEQHRSAIERLSEKINESSGSREQAEKDLGETTERLTVTQNAAEEVSALVRNLRTELVDLESNTSRLQNELAEIDSRERSTVIRRERLAAEQDELRQNVENYDAKRAQMETRLSELRSALSEREQRVNNVRGQRQDRSERILASQQEIAVLRTDIAGKQARYDLMMEETLEAGGFAAGAQHLLDPSNELPINRNVLLGRFSDLIQTDDTHREALEAVLHSYLDAVVLSEDIFAIQILAEVEQAAKGSTRLVAVKTSADQAPSSFRGPGEPLINHVRFDEAHRPLVERLLQNVFIIDSAREIPHPLPPEVTYVSLAGAVMSGHTRFDYFKPAKKEDSPLAQRQSVTGLKDDIERIRHTVHEKEQALARLEEERSGDEDSFETLAGELTESRRELALCEGENQVITQEANEARGRSETVTFELNSLNEQDNSGEVHRTEVMQSIEDMRNRQSDHRSTIATKTEELGTLEQDRTKWLSEVTERRVHASECRQQDEQLSGQKGSLESHIQELESLIRDRAAGVDSYQSRINALRESITDGEAHIEPLEKAVTDEDQKLNTAREQRADHTSRLEQLETSLREKRIHLEELMSKKSELDVQVAEKRVHVQNVVERVTAEYQISQEQLDEEPEPEWDDKGQPDREIIETSVAEIRTKLDSMGPVNLVAIEEHEELQERYDFLSNQFEDLVKAKQQLHDMIRKINSTTTEMFTATFNAVNENFQLMFKKMFGGGSAKLVLVDEEEVLDSGIEIIARPPGKKLQTVSLLSGGERTMTAVALLFSLYQVKPSPFCVLDELDAALDDANIGRFVTVVKEFVKGSQFIVITHNRQTIGAADILYGVTMEQRGISKIVSVKFSDYEESHKKPSKASPPEPALA